MEVRPDSAETILLVDDDELVRKSAATLMASLGYRVLSAGSGSEALEVLRQDGPIDLLFTDVFMPGGMHGPQLVAAARRLRPELRILFTSGYFEYAGIRHALDPSIEQVSKLMSGMRWRRYCAGRSAPTAASQTTGQPIASSASHGRRFPSWASFAITQLILRNNRTGF